MRELFNKRQWQNREEKRENGKVSEKHTHTHTLDLGETSEQRKNRCRKSKNIQGINKGRHINKAQL